MADYLRLQIAQRLLNLQNEKQDGISADLYMNEAAQRHEEEYCEYQRRKKEMWT
jgi:hypothetical protein